MYELAELGARSIDLQYRAKQDVTTQDLEDLLKSVQIEGITSSYMYVVDNDNLFVYHKRPEKIGTVVANNVIKQLNEDIKNNNTYKESDIINYVDENGVTKYAAYAVSDTNKWISVIVCDEDDAMKNISMIQSSSMVVLLVMAAIMLVIGYVLALKITNPIAVMTGAIKDMASFDFTQSGKLDIFKHKSDETGEMERQIFTMEDNLQQIVSSIKDMSVQMSENARNLVKVTENINQASTDNSATSEELAASMEEISATAIAIDSNMGSILNNTEVIDKKSQNGVAMASEINTRAMDMNKNAVESNNKTMEMYNDVKDKTQKAIEQSKAVEKVNVLATAIQKIADQTSLLSLNASIEAARVGEAGKGFAVVAGEIGQLASQSTSTVKSIMEIVAEVNAAVKNMDIIVAEKTTQVVTLSDEVMNVVNSTNEDSETLSRIADQFIL